MKIFFAVFVALLFGFVSLSFGQDVSDRNNDSILFAKVQTLMENVGNPKGTIEVEEINHKAMNIGIACDEKLPAWTFHVLLPEALLGKESRTNDFRIDTAVHCTIGTAQDYSLTVIVDGKKKQQNLGYDRGHLAPSADFKWSKTAISESFYYSNMTPQRPALNRQSWALLEESIRKSIGYDTTVYYIVTGPILHNYSGVTGGPNEIPVPCYFYKAILALGSKPKGIAFIMPNEKCIQPLFSYALTIDELEEQIGFDLFPFVEEAIQTAIEAEYDFASWNF